MPISDIKPARVQSSIAQTSERERQRAISAQRSDSFEMWMRILDRSRFPGLTVQKNQTEATKMVVRMY